MKIIRLAGLVVAIASSVCTSMTLAQSASEASVPTLKEGNRWKYSVVDLWKKVELRTRELIVAKVTENGYTYTIKLSDKDGTSAARSTRELNSIITNRDVPDDGVFRFPLSVGKKWKSKHFGTGRDGEGRTNVPTTTECDREVVSKEVVGVPAGSFDAYKLEAKCLGKLDYSGARLASHSFRTEFVYWYASEVGRNVKIESRYWNVNSIMDAQILEELVEYKH